MIIRRQEFCFKPLITACIHVIALTDNFFFFIVQNSVLDCSFFAKAQTRPHCLSDKIFELWVQERRGGLHLFYAALFEENIFISHRKLQ